MPAVPASSRTAPLLEQLAQALPERPFALRLWDGGELPPTSAGPTFTLHAPDALAQLVRAPGELGLGRAYVLGLVEVDDIDGALELIDDWQPPTIGYAQRARLLRDALRACGLVRPPRTPSIELRLRGRRHTLTRDARAVRYHYDVSNDFFALFLDRSMTYSCAIFSRGARSLEEAQEAKLELVCQKLALQPGERVLDVGCGWGSFVIHAASHHGVRAVGITLSEPQAELARRRVHEAGLADRVEIRVMDYRQLRGERFDAIASIGMVEHVGRERIDVYARELAALLPPGGRLLNHGIAQLAHGEDEDAGPVSERYVFPDALPLHLSRVQLALERAGFVSEHVEGFASDYAETLTHWIERFDARLDEARHLAGAQRTRVWRLYLRAARRGFQTGFESVYQVRCRLAG